MWDSYLGRITTFRHLIKLAPDEVRSVRSAPHLAGPTTRQVLVNQIDLTLKEGVIGLLSNEVGETSHLCTETRKFTRRFRRLSWTERCNCQIVLSALRRG